MENNVSNSELLKEINRLQDLLVKHGICEDCGELYDHHFDEPFASCGCKQSEWYELTPHMKQVLELKANCDALAAQNLIMRSHLQIAHDCINGADETGYVDDVGFVDFEALSLDLKALIESTPQQCLRDVQAEAGRAGYVAGVNDRACEYMDHSQIQAGADYYAAKVRKGEVK